MEKSNKKFALVLSGGGFLGAYEVGALNYINTYWKEITKTDSCMKFNVVGGVSVGSLNGVLVALDKMNELNKLWQDVIDKGHAEIFTSDYILPDGNLNMNFDKLKQDLFPDFKINFSMILKGIINSIGRIFNKKIPSFMDLALEKLKSELEKYMPEFKALAKNDPLKNKLSNIVTLQGFPENTTYLCGFVSLNDGEYYGVTNKEFRSDTDLINGILASTSMPIIWSPVEKSTFIRKSDKNLHTAHNLVDGGVRNISPLGNVIEIINEDKDDCEYEIFVINCHGIKIENINDKNWNILQNAQRSLTEITLSEIFRNDIENFKAQNILNSQLSKAGIKPLGFGKFKLNKETKIHIIQPESEGILGNSLDTTPEKIKFRKEKGYNDAKEYFEKN